MRLMADVPTWRVIVHALVHQILGASHGFDPGASTSGFVVWINGRGVMVDPPLNSGDLLRKAGMPRHGLAPKTWA